MGVTQTIDGREVVLDDSERQPVEVWTRVMGYHRPVASFNTGKKGEFAERLPFCTAKVERVLFAPERPVGSDPDGGPFECMTRVTGITTPTWRNHAAAAPTAPDDLYCHPAATGEATGYSAGPPA